MQKICKRKVEGAFERHRGGQQYEKKDKIHTKPERHHSRWRESVGLSLRDKVIVSNGMRTKTGSECALFETKSTRVACAMITWHNAHALKCGCVASNVVSTHGACIYYVCMPHVPPFSSGTSRALRTQSCSFEHIRAQVKSWHTRSMTPHECACINRVHVLYYNMTC